MSSDSAPTEALKRHLDWSKKQGRILTANGSADRLYHADRGYPFRPEECPHFHLQSGTTREAYCRWKSEQQELPIVGVWARPLFYGGWEHSTGHDEVVFNAQTRNLFIDLRIPSSRRQILSSHFRSLDDMNGEQLRYYARQHVFSGFSKLVREDGRLLCTRHHCIDWNFVGTPRSRPNKWWVDMADNHVRRETGAFMWKEWSYARDEQGQHYYCEHWERLAGSNPGPVVALRKEDSGRDGVLVIVGDHFSYVLGREHRPYRDGDFGSLVDLVDDAVTCGELEVARQWLGIQGGHGRISSGWMLDNCIEPWKEGTALWKPSSVSVVGASVEECYVLWNNERWYVFDCNLATVSDLSRVLHTTGPSVARSRL
jgi:hypothetical protein